MELRTQLSCPRVVVASIQAILTTSGPRQLTSGTVCPKTPGNGQKPQLKKYSEQISDLAGQCICYILVLKKCH